MECVMECIVRDDACSDMVTALQKCTPKKHQPNIKSAQQRLVAQLSRNLLLGCLIKFIALRAGFGVREIALALSGQFSSQKVTNHRTPNK